MKGWRGMLAGVAVLALVLAGCKDNPAGHTHIYGEWEVTTPATCGVPGVETRTCSCEHSQTRAIPQLTGIACGGEVTIEGIEMVIVNGGTFTMGCTPEQENDCWEDENPPHSVTLSDFYIGKYEVTLGLWNRVMGANPSHSAEDDDLPVGSVSWNEVQTFIAALNEQVRAQTGGRFRLPTEAEWEYAARGGSGGGKGYKYSGGNDIDDVAWYNNSSGTKPVGAKQANELGIYDMSGNVWEYVSDWYGSDYYASSGQTDPAGPPSGSQRVHRGGSLYDGARYCRISARRYYPPDGRSWNLGFRLAFSP